MSQRTPNIVATGDRRPDKGDTVRTSCRSCGAEYRYEVGESDGNRCPKCSEEFDNLDRIGGSMRVQDDEERQEIAESIESDELGVWVDERVGDLWVYRK